MCGCTGLPYRRIASCAHSVPAARSCVRDVHDERAFDCARQGTVFERALEHWLEDQSVAPVYVDKTFDTWVKRDGDNCLQTSRTSCVQARRLYKVNISTIGQFPMHVRSCDQFCSANTYSCLANNWPWFMARFLSEVLLTPHAVLSAVTSSSAQ